jgi:hypothetical protein
MNTTTSKQLLDTAGSTHTIALDPAGITLDGKPCRLVVKDTQVDLLSLDPALGVISVAPAALWHAFAGGDPTAEDAGLIQAHALASFTAMQEIAELTGRLRPILDDIDRHVHQHSKPALPSYRFSPFVSQLLATLDGTEEQTLAVARILKQSLETIRDWGAQAGKSTPPLQPLANQDQQSPVFEEQMEKRPGESASPDTPEREAELKDGKRRGKRGFAWTDEHERLLEEAFDTSQHESTNARLKEIAARFDWPFHVVDYRLRQLRTKRQQSPREPREETLQEDDQLEEAQPIAVSPKEVDVDRSPASLPLGPFLWDVKIEGKLQRWQMDIVYGQFPQKAGAHFVYREREYVLLQVASSMIAVTPVVTVEERSPEMQLAAV